jgi:Restriction endonuclease
VVDLATAGDTLDMRWIDDRRDATLSAEASLRYAPASWHRWVDEGRAGIPRVRRRVMSSRVRSREDQMPAPSSDEEALLQYIYKYFEGRKHVFELLAARVAAGALGGQGGLYREGWLTRAAGDGGLDFVARLDVGSPSSNTPLVVLGQAKCVVPGSSISPDEVARVVARLRRGWIGVFVTTGVFSRQAQVEMIDDEYPIVLIPAVELVDHVRRMASADHDGSVQSLLDAMTSDYPNAVTYRRPEEVLSR